MTRTILARYEHGALRLLEPVEVPEGATVEVTIVTEGWSRRMQALLERVRDRADDLEPDDVEAEITAAAAEVKAERLRSA
jgi:predicted DNA-binding antitoxin AbrB/MazE fold protein